MSVLDERFTVMGARGRIVLADRAPGDEPSPRLRRAHADARARLDDLERRWTRFDPRSDLSRLTDDPRAVLPADPDVGALVRAGAWAGRTSGGLVDITLGAQIAQAGYDGHWTGSPAPLPEALAAAPPRAAASPDPAARWSLLGADRHAGTIRRPPGVALDSGGIGKGLAADLVAAQLVGLRFFVDVGGDVAFGCGGAEAHGVVVEHPLTGAPAHRLAIASGGVATSGLHRRIWRTSDPPGFAHHLLDPATGRPAWTGVLAVTAVGRSALEAEVLAKTALLRGPRGARATLAGQGGVIVAEDGAVAVVPALRALARNAVRERAVPA
ncbi:MAG TPA: FAD:protein FMN transferase [Baekduia sp.]|uniref:FAD:protein FMN transferase n=1 Tax=Baekduia sp. TaxID=2600305 RepID=UPI002D783F23|nr:FAD:protein FMN transferase [Baekduia sp.]HET6508223.1 FAD:protein FMN transferase [Baekduia sp.]